MMTISPLLQQRQILLILKDGKAFKKKQSMNTNLLKQLPQMEGTFNSLEDPKLNVMDLSQVSPGSPKNQSLATRHNSNNSRINGQHQNKKTRLNKPQTVATDKHQILRIVTLAQYM